VIGVGERKRKRKRKTDYDGDGERERVSDFFKESCFGDSEWRGVELRGVPRSGKRVENLC
jgi:hypothetical protein